MPGRSLLMVTVARSALVHYRPQQIFDLVDAVELYPEFLPWCSSATADYRDELVTRATIHVSYRGIKQSFSTENRKDFPRLMTMHLVQGPFRSLEGEWRFTPLGAEGCKIDFCLQYEFSSALLEKIAGPVFGHIAGTMVDAFLKRADQQFRAK